jgi:hypothetical protein
MIRVHVVVKTKDGIPQITALDLQEDAGGSIAMPLHISQVPIWGPDKSILRRCSAKFIKKGKSGRYMYEEEVQDAV